MINRKNIALILTAIFLISSVSIAVEGRIPIKEALNNNVVDDTGTIGVNKLSSESVKPIYFINGDEGTYFLGKLFKKYLPINMDDFEEFKQEGLRVEFTGIVALRSLTSILLALKLRALPIVIKTIEKLEEPQNEPPIAEFSFSPAFPKVSDIVEFKDDSFDPDGDIIAYNWDFGDGEHSEEQYPIHQYLEVGKYYVTLSVIDNDYETGEKIHEITVVDEQTPEYGKLFGTVKEKNNPENPISNAKVAAYPQFSDPSCLYYSTYTNELGEYTLEVESGIYTVIASKEGYEIQILKVDVKANEENEVNFLLKKVVDTVDFYIDLEGEFYKVGTSIQVLAGLVNNGDEPVKLNELSLEHYSLDFVLLTPDGRKIHYIGECDFFCPEQIILEPGESHEIIIDITNANLGDKNGLYDFRTLGDYLIKGYYKSLISYPSGVGQYKILTSEIHSFTIEE